MKTSFINFGARAATMCRALCAGREEFVPHFASPSMHQSVICAYTLFLVSAIGVAKGAAPSIVMASHFSADRVYVYLSTTASAGTLRFYSDTGGSLAVTSEAATRAHFRVTRATDPDLLQALGPEARVAFPPAFRGPEMFTDAPPFVVLESVAQIPGWPAQADGILGQAWFGGHVWTWDYPRSRLILRPPAWTPRTTDHPIPVSFKSDARGHRETNFPRIMVRIDGEDLPMLFDTGAETFLTPTALKQVNDRGPRLRATSMIMHSVFERWRARHPNWPVIDDAQVTTNSRMMQVPSVEVGGVRTGPVWITERPDKNFIEYMSAMTSEPVRGSAGGKHLPRRSRDARLRWLENVDRSCDRSPLSRRAVNPPSRT